MRCRHNNIRYTILSLCQLDPLIIATRSIHCYNKIYTFLLLLRAQFVAFPLLRNVKSIKSSVYLASFPLSVSLSLPSPLLFLSQSFHSSAITLLYLNRINTGFVELTVNLIIKILFFSKLNYKYLSIFSYINIAALFFLYVNF